MSTMQDKEIIAWRCSVCGEATMPEDIMQKSMTSASGIDIVTVAHCVCGNAAILSWSIRDWTNLHRARKAQLVGREAAGKQRQDSENGRTVAEFRRALESGDTIADWGMV
jgi:hypothetical protein